MSITKIHKALNQVSVMIDCELEVIMESYYQRMTERHSLEKKLVQLSQEGRADDAAYKHTLELLRNKNEELGMIVSCRNLLHNVGESVDQSIVNIKNHYQL